MKRFLISVTVTTMLALPLLAAGQETPIPPEAARRTPLTQSGEQDFGQPVPGQQSGTPEIRQPATRPGRIQTRAPLGRQGADYDMVRRAQEELRQLGYDPGPIDGISGPQTQQALRTYQRDYNLPVTGRLNAQTKQKLLGDEHTSLPENWRETPTSTGRLMNEGEIQVAEEHLKEFGFDPGPADGVFTAQTEAALRAFQKRRGLVVSGILDNPTRRELLKGTGSGGTASGG